MVHAGRGVGGGPLVIHAEQRPDWVPTQHKARAAVAHAARLGRKGAGSSSEPGTEQRELRHNGGVPNLAAPRGTTHPAGAGRPALNPGRTYERTERRHHRGGSRTGRTGRRRRGRRRRKARAAAGPGGRAEPGRAGLLVVRRPVPGGQPRAAPPGHPRQPRTGPERLDEHRRFRPARGSLAPAVGAGVRGLRGGREALVAGRAGPETVPGGRLGRAGRAGRAGAGKQCAALSHHLGDRAGRGRAVRAARARPPAVRAHPRALPAPGAGTGVRRSGRGGRAR